MMTRAMAEAEFERHLRLLVRSLGSDFAERNASRTAEERREQAARIDAQFPEWPLAGWGVLQSETQDGREFP